ncbi:MAG TPA: hypothetical protein VK508_13430 [Cyclobacteriaceae bacterium]|nr:hypothetical protein [Cyclobacteriaceae bacterium]
MRSWLYSSVLGFTLLCISCIDQSDYELDGVSLNPTLALPLVHGKLTIGDMLNKQDSVHFKTDANGLIYVAYEEQFVSEDVRALFKIPDVTVNKSFVMPGITVPPLTKAFRSDSIITTVDFGMSPEKLTEIALAAGRIGFSTSLNPSSSQLDYEVVLVLPGFKSKSNQSINTTIKGSGNIDLADYTLTLNSNKFDLKLVLVFKKKATSTTISPASSVNVHLNFGNFSFTHIKGFLGDQTTSLDAQTIDLGAFDGEIFKGAKISIAQPKVTFTVINSDGIPCQADFIKLEARKPDASPLTIVLNPGSPVSLAYPAVMGETKETIINVGNVKELLDYAPTEIFYQADVRINPGLTTGNNFLLDTSRLRVKLNLEAPLWGSATGIVLKDTLDVDLENTESSEVSSASLKLTLINQFPLDGNVQFVLTDASYNVIGTLLLPDQTNIIKGSTVDSDGELQAAGAYLGTIELDKTKIEKIFQAKHIIITAGLQTSRNSAGAATNVKFMADYFLSIEAGILATLKLNVE